jgi:lipopolysaccharide exporter
MTRSTEVLAFPARYVKAAGLAMHSTGAWWVPGGFMRHLTILASGTFAAQLLSLAAAPILSRLFTPASFGIFGVFVSISAILGVVANLRYQVAVLLPESDDDAANLLALSVMSTALLVGLTILALTIMGASLASLLGAPALGPFLWWLPASVGATGLYQALNYWSTRRKHFGRLSISRIGQSGAMNSTQLVGGFFGGGAAVLIGGQVIGQIVAASALAFQVWRDEWAKMRPVFAWSRMRRLATEFRQFPLYSAPQGLLNAVSQNIPLLLLAVFFNPAAVGLYLLAHKLLQVPIGLVGASVRQVFFQRASESYNEGRNVRHLQARFTAALAACAVVPTALVVIWGPDIFSFVLGNEWRESGEYARWLILWLFMGFVNPPSVVLAEVYRRQKHLLVYDALLLAARAAALLAGGLAGSIIMAIASYSLVGVAFNAGLIVWVWRITGPQAERPLCRV